MEADVRQFCRSCIQYFMTIGDERVPRPLAHEMHAKKPKELLYLDFLSIHDTECSFKYLFIIRYDASLFFLLHPNETPDAMAACEGLIG